MTKTTAIEKHHNIYNDKKTGISLILHIKPYSSLEILKTLKNQFHNRIKCNLLFADFLNKKKKIIEK